MDINKEKTITITVTSDEVDAVEDAIWCHNTHEWWVEMHKTHLGSFWKKLAGAFDS